MNNTYDIESLKAKYYGNQVQPTGTSSGSSDIEELKKKYYSSPDTTVTQQVEPIVPTRQDAVDFSNQGARKVLDLTTNIGTGAGLSIGNTMTGIAAGAANLVGAKGAANKIKALGEKAFVKPAETSQKTIAGKAGKIVTDVAQFMAPVTKAGALGTALNIGKDVLVGTGQAGGNIKAGLASGAVTAVTGGLNKLPQATGFITKGARTLAPGYAADVAQGLAGQRGENREGKKAFIPGLNTVVAGAIPVVAKGSKVIARNVLPSEAIANAKTEWKIPENETKSTFNKAKEIYKRAVEKGHNIENTLVGNNIFKNENIVDGVYQTKDTADALRQSVAITTRDILRPKLESIRAMAPKLNPNQVVIKIKSRVSGDKFLDPIDKEKILDEVDRLGNAWNKQYPNGIDIVNALDEKILNDLNSKYSPVGDVATNLKANRSKAVADVFRRELSSMAKSQGLDLDKFQNDLTNIYRSADYLEALNGKKPTQTLSQKVVSKLSRGTGAVVGAKFGVGILPTMAGYNIAGALESAATNARLPIGQRILKSKPVQIPAGIEAVKNYKRPSFKNQKGSSPVKTMVGIGSGLAGAAMLGAEYARRNKEKKSNIPSVDSNQIQGVNLPEIKASIANNETNGVENPYSFTKFSGDKRLGNDNGKYQITDGELKAYAPKFLGRPVSREEFLANPDLQEAYMDSKIISLASRGLSLDEIFATHRAGMSDLTKSGLEKTKKRAGNYVTNAKKHYATNK